MSLSASIAPHLPYLRRFSRAVSGSQQSGDALVAAMLEAIVADIDIFSPGFKRTRQPLQGVRKTVHLGGDTRTGRPNRTGVGAQSRRKSHRSIAASKAGVLAGLRGGFQR